MRPMPRECSFFLPQHVKCGIPKNLTIFFLFDPENKLYQIGVLCQKHSDLVIGKYMNRYNELSRQIKIKEEERRKQTRASKEYEITFNSKISNEIKELRNKKQNLSKFECRGIDEKYTPCNNEIKKGTARLTVDCFHSNGSERHYFYFCSIKCLNSFRYSLGLIEPMQAKLKF